MQQRFIQNHNRRRLILIFAGWGVDANFFTAVSKQGYDVMVVFDYRNTDFDISLIDRYEEICIVAWSLGVWHAEAFICANTHLPVTRCIAVNGTLLPIDGQCGIPPRIYDLTAQLPDEIALTKFYRRICGGQAAMETLMPALPDRKIDELRDELAAIRKRVADGENIPSTNWDEIYLSDADLIFPYANMLAAWNDAAARVTTLHGAAHAIDFAELISQAFVDKDLVGERFASAADSYDDAADVQHRVAQRLTEIAERQVGNFTDQDILEIGCGAGMLTRMYLPLFSESRVTALDLAPVEIGERANGNDVECESCDAELYLRQMPSESVDVVFSSSTIQWFNSSRKAIGHIARILRPGGNAFISCYIDGTLPQLKQVAPEFALHYPHLEDMARLAGGADVETEVRDYDLGFDSAAEALCHLRDTGVNSLRRKPMTVAQTRQLMRSLMSDGKAALKFNTLYIKIRKHG